MVSRSTITPPFPIKEAELATTFHFLPTSSEADIAAITTSLESETNQLHDNFFDLGGIPYY